MLSGRPFGDVPSAARSEASEGECDARAKSALIRFAFLRGGMSGSSGGGGGGRGELALPGGRGELARWGGGRGEVVKDVARVDGLGLGEGGGPGNGLAVGFLNMGG